MIYAFLNGKKEQDRYIKNFAAAIGAKLVHTARFIRVDQSSHGVKKVIAKKPLPNCTGFIFAGLMRGNAHILNLALDNKIPFYYVDHAYFNSGYRDPQWMRVVKNGFMQNTLVPTAKDRKFNRNFEINFRPYDYKDKKNVLVFPPSNTVERVFNATEWEENVIKGIRQHTDRPIVIRKKSGGPIMDNQLLSTLSKERYDYKETLEESLDNAYCVVAFNTSVTLRALEKGIPVICDRYCPAFPISNKLKDINDLKEYDREPLFQSLAQGQFTIQEISKPETFNYINNSIQWKGALKWNID